MTDISKKFTESTLTLQNRNQLTLSGVEKVISMSESQICLVACSSSLSIYGNGLTVQKLDVENGILKITGTVGTLKYDEKKENFLKRIFK